MQTFPAVSYQSTKNLSLVVFGLLAVTIVIEAVNTLLSLGHLYFPYPLELDGGESMSIWVMFIGLIAILQLPIFISTVIFFLIWLHRSYKNLDPLGARHLEHTPGWAVGYWFIPILNLFKPFQVVRDIWNESDPDVDPEMGFLSGGGGTPALLGVWWALWLSSNIIANASSRMDMTASGEFGSVSTTVYGVASILTMFAAIAAIKVVTGITQRQEDRFRKVGVAGSYSEPPPPPTNF